MNSAGSFSNSAPNRTADFLREKQVAGLRQMERRVGERASVCLLLLCSLSQALCQQCGGPCSCPLSAPCCPAGVPRVLDGCGCCQVCASQRGEACSEKLVCDARRGLQCDHSASYPGGPGQCVGQDELGCELNGVTYEEGQVFLPSCGLRCQCTGGGVTCVRLCSDGLRLPSPDCPNPRYLQLAGKCCKETSSDCIQQSTLWGACSHSCGPGVSTRVSNGNPAFRLETQTRLPCPVPGHSHGERPRLPLHPKSLFCASGRQQPSFAGRSSESSFNCVLQASGWCEPSYRAAFPVRLEHQGCLSARLYRPRYCGHCPDGRCCSPRRTHTIPVAFRCPIGYGNRVLRLPLQLPPSIHPGSRSPQGPHTTVLEGPGPSTKEVP
ncbi:LOW QUALITY PROTEIN: CCN family member 5-like [Anguilla anguilla]|uniref:LOW QUALITY PROTEIN: CCN family member 5-like n=1 Tax=Anguilla anguilla TaxID=7936 RepID=UPI0015AD7E52|nr:LOW QUALITY PROTEIN: CCN family member 5-like [Anguilla anguilla]